MTSRIVQSLEGDGQGDKLGVLENIDSMTAVDNFIENLEGYIHLYAMRVPRKARDNIIAANVLTTFLRKIGGACMFDHHLGPGNRVIRSFSWLGSICVVFWYTLFFICLYRVYYFNQTILLRLHYSIIGAIGDQGGIMVAALYMTYMMWKLPLSVSGGRKHIQTIIDADAAMKEMGISISYNKTARLAAMAGLLQIFAGVLHYLTIWLPLSQHESSHTGQFPYSRIYQVVFFYAVAMVATTQYCSYLNMLRQRFAKLNLRICEVRDCKKSGKIYLQKFRLRKSEFITLLAANMRSCAKLYSTLTDGAYHIDIRYGQMAVVTMVAIVFNLMLSITYFIEGHANHIFNQGSINYLCFLNYLVWEIVYAFTIVFVCTFFCEWTKSEASETATLVHEVINEDFDPAVTAVCMQFSLQLMHQRPQSVHFYRLNYQVLLKEVRTMAFLLTFTIQSIKKYGVDNLFPSDALDQALVHHHENDTFIPNLVYD